MKFAGSDFYLQNHFHTLNISEGASICSLHEAGNEDLCGSLMNRAVLQIKTGTRTRLASSRNSCVCNTIQIHPPPPSPRALVKVTKPCPNVNWPALCNVRRGAHAQRSEFRKRATSGYVTANGRRERGEECTRGGMATPFRICWSVERAHGEHTRAHKAAQLCASVTECESQIERNVNKRNKACVPRLGARMRTVAPHPPSIHPSIVMTTHRVE